MNEEMEAELTKMDSRPENLAVSEDASVDEAVPFGLRNKRMICYIIFYQCKTFLKKQKRV